MVPVTVSLGGFNGTMVLVTVFEVMVYATMVLRVRLWRWLTGYLEGFICKCMKAALTAYWCR